MKKKDVLYKILVLISVATVVSGALQVVKPGLVLDVIGGESTDTSRHFFGIVGMFMVLFGGAMLHALLSEAHHPVVVLWAGLQKVGAFAAVGLGVWRELLSALALGVAGFDLMSGLLILWYWLTIRRAS